MNLNNLQENNKEAKAQAPKEQKTEEIEGLSLSQIKMFSSSEDLYWKRENKLKGVDVTRIDIRPSQFNGEYRRNKDGHIMFEAVISLVDKYDTKRLISGLFNSRIVKALVLALKEYIGHPTDATNLLGYCFDLECTGKDGNAYTYKAKCNGDANHEVEGIFDHKGNKIEEDK